MSNAIATVELYEMAEPIYRIEVSFDDWNSKLVELLLKDALYGGVDFSLEPKGNFGWLAISEELDEWEVRDRMNLLLMLFKDNKVSYGLFGFENLLPEENIEERDEEVTPIELFSDCIFSYVSAKLVGSDLRPVINIYFHNQDLTDYNLLKDHLIKLGASVQPDSYSKILSVVVSPTSLAAFKRSLSTWFEAQDMPLCFCENLKGV